MATLDELIGSWRLSLRAANRAPRTVAQYVDVSLAQIPALDGRARARSGARSDHPTYVKAYLAEVASTRSASTAQTR